MSDKAKAVRIVGAGGPEVLRIEDFDRPEPGRGEILVEVATAGLNRADCLQRKGVYPAPKGTVPDIPGLEFSGVVCGLGTGASRWQLGDSVMGIGAGGAMATHLAVSEDVAMPIPKGMSLESAGAIPEVFVTAYDALEQAEWSPDKSVLIHAIGSGVGSAALLLAKRAGMQIVGTSRTQKKLDKARQLGLLHSVCLTEKTFAKAVKAELGGGADCILDFIGAAYLGENLKAIALKGHLVVIGLLGGVKGDLPLGLLLAKRATIVGTVLRSRSNAEKAELITRFVRDVLPGFDSGELSPVVDRVMPMAEIQQAHQLLESNQSFGKIVMSW